MPDLAFLHTGEAHITNFDALADSIAPDLSRAHWVDASLLARAQSEEPDPDLDEDIQQAMLKASAAGARRVICTCSSIGAAAEQAGKRFGFEARRIDRAMAKHAVENAERITVFAALDSTLEPTDALLNDEAKRQQKRVTITTYTIAAAWPLFELGDFNRYHAEIAKQLNAFDISGTDLIVLAQASMAGACVHAKLKIPVLSSPIMGLRAICEELV